MEDFKHLFNITSLYDTIFIKIDTKTILQQENLINNHNWMNFIKKRYPNECDSTLFELNENKSKYHPEFSEITSISWGVVKVDMNGNILKEIRSVSGHTEKQKLETFFKILELFREKKLDGIICGHNILGYEIPFLIKRGLKYNLKIPKSIKNNLLAKPWEYNIVDTINLWRFTGNDYVALDLISEYLGFKNDNFVNPDDKTKNGVNLIIELYIKLREM